MDKVKYVSVPDGARIIVISDIHGELDLLQGLLEKVQFKEEDFLIINGDLAEKGHNSTGVVRYVMDLEKRYPHVYVTEGNCEAIIDELMRENPKLLNYLRNRPNTLYNEWLKEIDYTIDETTTVEYIKDLLTTHYADEIEWLSQLPTAIETDNYIFVHAGLESVDDWKKTDREKALTLPAFMEHSHGANKYVIVGHWPVINYSRDVPTHNPIVQKEKKIIATDGGNVIKSSGQLNAFLIETTQNGDSFSYQSFDHLDKVKVKQDYEGDSTMVRALHYPHYDIEPIRKEEHFTLCRQPDSGQKLYVKNEYITEDEEGNFCSKSDISCALLNVREGEEVSVLDNSCSGFTLIKKDGDIGWIKKGIVE